MRRRKFQGGKMNINRVIKISLYLLIILGLGMNSGQQVTPVEPLTPAPTAETGEPANETPSLWFVELANAPLADGGNLDAIVKEKEAFRKNARGVGLKYTERFSFDTLWNGLSICVGPEDLAILNRISGVKALYPVMAIPVPPVQSADNYIELATALAMTGADIAQSELGFTGAGVKVGIIDTGIDYHHPDLGGGFGPGYRVTTGYDFVGDDFGINYIPVPDPDPDDCHGHGTHVAGIVGANGGIKGVAPGVTFGAYRVFGCTGSTYADIMIAAMERALADGMDIINMSIGSAFQWPEYPTAAASDRMVRRGIVVVAAAGNDGSSGLYGSSAPGVGDKVISVASFVNTHVNYNAFTVSPDDTAIGYTNATGAPFAPFSGSFPMARTGTATSTADACSALPAGSLSGKVALIRRGGCTFHVKAMNALNAGAAAVVLYNNAAGRFNPTVVGTPPITIPVVAVSDTEGLLIDSRLAAGPVMMTWTAGSLSLPNSGGGLIAASSSYGLCPDLAIKPDISAPGGSIRSTVPIEQGSYAIYSGTSMASPHVAGAAALLLEAHPHTPPQIVRTALQNSSEPKVWGANPGLGYLENIHRQGAGMLNIDDAILATTKIEPGKLSVGEGEFGPKTFTLSVENKSLTTVTYDLSYVNAVSTGELITPSFYTSDAMVTFSPASLTVPANGSASVNVTIHPASGPVYGQYGGFVAFTPQGGGQVYRVPFAGFVGDYQSIVALAPTAYGFPWLAKLTGGSYYKQSDGATYTLSSGDIPYFLVHLDHQVRRLRMEVFAAKGKAWHRAYDLEYYRRSTTATSFFAFGWDGMTRGGNKIYTVPEGEYVIKISILKALGEDDNPAHWETWTSPKLIIDRP
jgi:minor extracellular serine protease Vpr